MRVDDQTKVTNAIASAIEYISKLHASSLSAVVVRELRAANAIVSVAAKREVETMTTPDLERLARHALDTLRLRRWQEFEDAYQKGVEPFVVIAHELAHPPFEQPRLTTGRHEIKATSGRCYHCAIEIDRKTVVLTDEFQIEPVMKAWPGGNFYVRVSLEHTKDETEPVRWTRLDLCEQCFEYVVGEVARQSVLFGDENRRRAPERPGES